MPAPEVAIYRAYLDRRPAPEVGTEFLLDQLLCYFIQANSEGKSKAKSLDHAHWLKPPEPPKGSKDSIKEKVNFMRMIEGGGGKKRRRRRSRRKTSDDSGREQ